MLITQNLNMSAKSKLTLAVSCGLTMLLTACGGGGGSSNNDSSSSVSNSTVNTTPATVSATTNTTTPTNTATQTTSPESAALAILNENRTRCGFGGLTVNQALNNTASNHANYQKLVSESNKMSFASHYEKTETDSAGNTLANTGLTNAYYSGQNLADRLAPKTLGANAVATNYASGGHGENIALSSLGTSNANYVVNSVGMTQDMLRGLFAAPYHMQGLLFPYFKEVGINYQLAKWSSNGTYNYGNILEIVSALPAGSQVTDINDTLSFPCNNVVTAYELNDEYPNPFGTTRNLKTNPVGQPLYVIAPSSKSIQSATADIRVNGQSVGNLTTLTSASDPNKLLKSNEVVFIPNTPLLPSTTYQASYQVNFTDGTTASRSFNFTTQAKTN